MTAIYSLCAVIGGTVLVCQFILSLVGFGADHGDASAGGDFHTGDVPGGGDFHAGNVGGGGDLHSAGQAHGGFDAHHAAGGTDAGADHGSADAAPEVNHDAGQHAPTQHTSGSGSLLADLDADPGDLRSAPRDHGDHGDHGELVDGVGSRLLQILTFQTIVAALTFFGLAGLWGGASGWREASTFFVALVAGGGAMYGVHSLMKLLGGLRSDGTVRIERAAGARGVVYLRVPAQGGGAGKVHLDLQGRTVECEAYSRGQELPAGARIIVIRAVGSEAVEVESIQETPVVSHA